MKYLFVLLIGVILFTVGLWLSYKPVKEGMVSTDQVMLAGVGPSGLIHTATTGLASRPNWTSVTGNLIQISGSLGQMVGINSTNVVLYGTQYSTPGSPYTWVATPVSLTQLDFDYPSVFGIDSAGLVKYIDDITTNPTGVTLRNTTSTKTFKWINMSIGRAYAIGTDNNIYYAADARNPDWINVSGSIGGKTFTQLSYDGDDVVVLDSTNKLYYANSGLESAPNWRVLAGSVKQITMKNRMLFAIDTNNKVLFSPSATPDTAWIELSSSITFSYLTCFFPRTANMVQQRPAVMTPCRSGHSFFGGQCMTVCPSGFIENGINCDGIPITRASRAATVVPPLTFTCPVGFDVNLTNVATCVSILDNTVSATQPLKEVYSVTGSYTQTEAEAKCASYGGALATLDQITAASAAGAGWCTWGWYAAAGMIAFPVQTTNGCYLDAAPLKLRSQSAGTGKFAANCFGVKPPGAQFSDVQAFNAAGKQNQAPQCPFTFNVTTRGTCNSTCPTGSSVSAGSCSYPVVPKVVAARNNTNYTCPAGYQPPPIVTCSGTNCGTIVRCTQSCPAGYTYTLSNNPNIPSSCTRPSISRYYTGPLTRTEPVCNYGGYTLNTAMGKCVRSGYSPLTPQQRTIVTGCPSSAPEALSTTLSVNSTCYARCPAGTTGQGAWCVYANVTILPPINATYTPPCATGFVEFGGQCYQNCPAGSTDIGNHRCQIPNTIRTTRTPTEQKSSLTLCSSTEELIGTNCVTKCPPNDISSSTTCVAAPSTTRTGYAATYKCNSNETMLNGVCTTKCPEGTYPDGELCVPEQKVVAIPSTIKCISTAFGSSKKWLCDTEAAAAALLKDPSKTTSYVDPNDQVCIADDPTTNMYYCQSGADAKEKTGFLREIKMDYRATCDNVKKNYFDLSNNLTSLLLIQSGMSTGRDELARAKTALDSIYTQLNCANPASAQVTAICTQIQTGSTAIGIDSNDIGSVITNITAPIQAAISSRDSLLASITNFQCSL